MKKMCTKCKISKDISDFTKKSSTLDGYDYFCKPCRSSLVTVYRRGRRKEKMYAGQYGIDIEHLDDYITKNCEVCTIMFYPTRAKHTRCNSCGLLVAHVRLSISRYKKKAITIEDSVIIARKLFLSTSCCYCKRTYTETNVKSLDHIMPSSKGGTNDPSNINICCMQCNTSKGGLTIQEWLDLCKLVTQLDH